MMRVWLILGLSLWAALAEAATCYVRDGGTATGTQGISTNGGSWSQAYDQLSTAETNCARGDTIYVADGTYTGVTLNTAASGTTRIIIKKATIAEHGTETGWDNTYGDGQATFASTITISTNYWTIDGSYRDESNAPWSWFTSSGYGFAILNNGGSDQRQINMQGTRVDGITVKHTWIQGRSAAFSGAERRYAVDVDSGDESNRHANHLYQRNLFTDSNQHLFLRTSTDAIVEYNAFDNLGGDGDNHGNSVNCYWHCEGLIYRFNVARDIGEYTGWSGVTQIVAVAELAAGGNGIRPTVWIYGNLSFRSSGGDGVYGFNGSGFSDGDCLNCRVYNNTAVDGNMQFNQNWGVMFPNGSGNIASNNIFFDGTKSTNSSSPANSSLGTSGTLSYNAYGTGASTQGTNAQGSVTSALFTDYTNDVYTLASATSCGTTISGTAPDGGALDVDMLGNTRGADGCWDRGAFEFCAGGCGGGGGSSTGGSMDVKRRSHDLIFVRGR